VSVPRVTVARIAAMEAQREHERTKASNRDRPRRGLTVVEVLVALVIVAVGLLGMAGTASLSLRSTTTASRELLALREVERRLALSSAAGCDGAASGESPASASVPQLSWRVAEVSRGVRMVEAIARWHDGTTPRALRLRSALLC
jgi:prepilin-type N-terminal cleavage/methylation domain-containing protein